MKIIAESATCNKCGYRALYLGSAQFIDNYGIISKEITYEACRNKFYRDDEYEELQRQLQYENYISKEQERD